MKIIVAFDYLFIAEMLLKMIAFGAWSLPTTYFKKNWNLFDFFLALVGAVQICVPLFASQFVRSLLSLRPIRLVKEIKSMKRISVVIYKSIVSLINAGILLFFAIFIFALIGKN